MEYKNFLLWQQKTEVKELNQALANYPWQVFSVEFIQKDVYKVIAKEGIFCLKIANKSLKKMSFVVAAIEYLWQQGYQEMPNVVPTTMGEVLFTQGDKIWFAVTWLPGQQCVFASEGHLTASVKNLATFHLQARDFDFAEEPKQYEALPKRFAKQNQEILDFIEVAKDFAKSPKQAERAISKLYINNHQYYWEQGKRAEELLAKCDYQQLVADALANQEFIHGDVAARNFIISKSGGDSRQGYLIDFDYAKYDLQVIDLARLLERALRMTDYQIGNVDVVLDSYNKIKPLSKLELGALTAVSAYPQRFWRLCERGFNRKVAAESVYRRLSYLLANREKNIAYVEYLLAHN